MKYLIVNADDFGLTSGVNRAVIEAHTGGILTSATLMANMPAFDEAVRLAKAHLSLGVGLHFNITQGFPIANSSNVSSLLNEQGAFLGTSTALLRRWLNGRLRIQDIEIELRAQIETVIQAGLRLTHIDSHKHSHVLPPVCQAIATTIDDYGIKAVRLPRELWRFPRHRPSAKLIFQSLSALGLAQLCRLSKTRLNNKTTDAFVGVAQTGFWSKHWLLEVIRTLPFGITELMTHPGYDDAELGQVKTRLLESRANELELLTDPEVIATVRENHIELISYAQFDR